MIIMCKHTGRSKSAAHILSNPLVADERRGGAAVIEGGKPRAQQSQTCSCSGLTQ